MSLYYLEGRTDQEIQDHVDRLVGWGAKPCKGVTGTQQQNKYESNVMPCDYRFVYVNNENQIMFGCSVYELQTC